MEFDNCAAFLVEFLKARSYCAKLVVTQALFEQFNLCQILIRLRGMWGGNVVRGLVKKRLFNYLKMHFYSKYEIGYSDMLMLYIKALF